MVLVHGIGDLAPRDVLRSAAQAVRQTLPEVELIQAPQERETPRADGSDVGLNQAVLQWRDRSIRLIEFYWAGVAGKIRLAHPMLALGLILETLRELPLMGVGASTSRRLKKVAALAGLFQSYLVAALIVSAIGTIGELALRPEVPDLVWAAVVHRRSDSFSEAVRAMNPVPVAVELVKRTYLFTPLLGMFIALAGLYYAAVLGGFFYFLPVWLALSRRVSHVGALWRLLCAGSVLTLMITFLVIQALLPPVVGLQIVRHFGEVMTFGSVAADLSYLGGMTVMYALLYWITLRVTVTLGNLLRDIVHYLATDADGRPLATQRKIQHELGLTIRRLWREQRCERIILVAHSLGSVILVDLLRELAMGRDAKDQMTVDIVTAGSPIRRLICRLLPHRLPRPEALRDTFGRSSVLKVDRWFNAYRIFDYVGQGLTRSALPRDLLPRRRAGGDARQGVAEHLITPRFRWPVFHANYWGDRRFLEFVASEVMSPVLARAPRPGSYGSARLTD
ncbi:MAG: hypothetical protein HYS37_00475 [Candidatus Rokubacteria bacterium]|nr:hypothetical protein [Candidatus Rokubacteria bacterium]